MDDVEYKFTRPLSQSAVLEAFPDECKYYVPRKLAEVRRRLRPYLKYIDEVKHSDYPDEWKTFFINVCKEIYMPKDLKDRLVWLKNMERMMCASTRGVTDQDRDRAKDVSVWSLYTFNKRKGQTACCPFHDDQHPSFSVRRNKWICFSCGLKGDSIDFIQRLHGLPYYKAVEFILKNHV